MMDISYVTTKTYTLTLSESEVYKLKRILRNVVNDAGEYTTFASEFGDKLKLPVEVREPSYAEPG